MSADTATTPHLDLVIFGASGDLSVRKLLPALFMAHQHGSLPTQTRIIGVGRQPWSHEQYQSFVNEKCPDFIDKALRSTSEWPRFVSRLRFVSLDATDAAGYQALATECNASHPRVFYLATAPHLFADTVEHLHQAGLLNDQTRLVLEKPLGTDLASAKAIHTAVGRYLREDQIYRIDHYLGKETVQNLMVLRFGNAIFEPLWRAPFIKSVQITVAETVGVGSRAGFYDSAGALRDMVQNHLLQLLCIVAMEPPVSLHADDVRDEKLKVLRSLRPMDLAAIKRDMADVGTKGADSLDKASAKLQRMASVGWYAERSLTQLGRRLMSFVGPAAVAFGAAGAAAGAAECASCEIGRAHV